MATNKVIIACAGGLVKIVFATIDLDVCIIDYDTEGADPTHPCMRKTPDGRKMVFVSQREAHGNINVIPLFEYYTSTKPKDNYDIILDELETMSDALGKEFAGIDEDDPRDIELEYRTRAKKILMKHL